MDHSREPEPRSVQILGSDPRHMADTARIAADRGAQIVDINMGCPAKKVCNKAAGSALLRDEALVGRILETVVEAVNVPVTLKIRTGWDLNNRNGVSVARIAERAGIQALAVHGRTRACGFSGQAEYSTIGEIVGSVAIPVIANGDIDSPEKALWVLRETGASAVMVGRAALGRPWLFADILARLENRPAVNSPRRHELGPLIAGHLEELYGFYGEQTGIRIARKHVAWYLAHWPGQAGFLSRFNGLESASRQISLIQTVFGSDRQDQELAA
jgi:tRNA-dihydrouridine synthase B